MPRRYQGIKAPDGFTRYAARRLARKVPFVDGKYAFTTWMLRKHMKRKTLKKWIEDFRKYKRRKRRRKRR